MNKVKIKEIEQQIKKKDFRENWMKKELGRKIIKFEQI